MRAAFRRHLERLLQFPDEIQFSFRAAFARPASGAHLRWHAGQSSRRSCHRRHTSRAGHSPFPPRFGELAIRRCRKRPASLRGVPSVATCWKDRINCRISGTGVCHSRFRVEPMPSAKSSHRSRMSESHYFPLPRPFSSHILASTARRSSPSCSRIPKAARYDGKASTWC